jgi:AraC family L-rhamnose operon regulatory protein RhaS
LEEFTNVLRQNEQPVWKSSAEIRRCFEAIGHAVETDRNGSSISRLSVRLNELLVLVLDLFRSEKVPLDGTLTGSLRTVTLFLADLRDHPDKLSRQWTVAEMAAFCGLGVTQFIYHFRTVTNLTPMQYLTNCRLKHAAMLLRGSESSSITDVALACGFSSGQYFATVFARRFGSSPRDFRAGI